MSIYLLVEMAVPLRSASNEGGYEVLFVGAVDGGEGRGWWAVSAEYVISDEGSADAHDLLHADRVGLGRNLVLADV